MSAGWVILFLIVLLLLVGSVVVLQVERIVDLRGQVSGLQRKLAQATGHPCVRGQR